MIVGVRALKQNASAVVSDAAAGSIITITDRGRPVAQLVPLPTTKLAGLITSGLARPARRSITELPAPGPAVTGRKTLSETLSEARDGERY